MAWYNFAITFDGEEVSARLCFVLNMVRVERTLVLYKRVAVTAALCPYIKLFINKFH